MIIFTALAALLVIVCFLILGPALFNRRKLVNTDLQEENIVIARQRLAEIAGDTPEAEEARIELEAALIDDLKGPDYILSEDKAGGKSAAIMVMALIPLVAAILYLQWGSPARIVDMDLPTAEQIQANPQLGITQLINRLEQVLEEQPDDAAGWELAARTYMGTAQYAKAEQAYARLYELTGEHPDTLTAWADASLMVNNNQFNEQIASRVNRALELDPDHVSSLWLAALGARSIGRSDEALGYLNRLLPLVAGNAEAARETRAVIESLGGTVTASESTDGAARRIQVTVALSAELQDRVSTDDIVFVFATEAGGPPAPLAAVRLTAGELPTTLVLDQSNAMIAGRTVDSVERIGVTARIALDGKPARSPGDLESRSEEVADHGPSEIRLTIDTVVAE